MWKRTVCTKDCPDTCGFLAEVEGGRVVAVKGDPEHPFTNGFICQKAKHFPEHVHSPKRINTLKADKRKLELINERQATGDINTTEGWEELLPIMGLKGVAQNIEEMIKIAKPKRKIN